MAAWTYQIAVKTNGKWCREYVCAEDRVSAVQQFLEENPFLTLDHLLQSEQLEVERCV